MPLSRERVHWEGTRERHLTVYQISICRNKLQFLCSPAWHSLIQPVLKINMPIKPCRKGTKKKSPEKSKKAGAAEAGQASLGQAAGRGPLIWVNEFPACLSRGQHDGFRNINPRTTTVGNKFKLLEGKYMTSTTLLCIQSLQSIPKELYFSVNLHIFLLYTVMTAKCI